MTTHEPPNLRDSERCYTCKHYVFGWNNYCGKHNHYSTERKDVCDDYEAEGKEG